MKENLHENMNIKNMKKVRTTIVVLVLVVLSVFRCLWYIVTLFFLNSRIRVADCADTRGDEISLIKNLLSTIFERYKTDMTSLHNLVEMTTGDLNRWVERGIVDVLLKILLPDGGVRSMPDLITLTWLWGPGHVMTLTRMTSFMTSLRGQRRLCQVWQKY